VHDNFPAAAGRSGFRNQLHRSPSTAIHIPRDPAVAARSLILQQVLKAVLSVRIFMKSIPKYKEPRALGTFTL
jgi:hypothetical protein